MPELSSFDYAIVRVVPRVERGEYFNVGVILFSRTRNFLDARMALDRERLAVVDPEIDVDEVERHLDDDAPCLSRRTGKRPDRPALAVRALQLAGLAAQHGNPDLSGPLRPVPSTPSACSITSQTHGPRRAD